MYAQKRNAQVLTLLPRSAETDSPAVSPILEIRKNLLNQVQLLRSTSIAIILVGFFASIMVWISDDPIQVESTFFDNFIMTVVCLGILVCSLVLSLIVYLCADQVEVQARTLNEEV